MHHHTPDRGGIALGMLNKVKTFKIGVINSNWNRFHWNRGSKFTWNTALYGKAYVRNVRVHLKQSHLSGCMSHYFPQRETP